eukprot:TRINITY_DN3153_c0_g1_i1.p1 TRINITY_DN3153_c0_g1~~TRINITY_DN3153_c0_g1_i1.p1  ORF type:complete len:241 (-),score=35.03 TRINITY_DN3153_c0_g1_i1:105-827(-)
MMIDHAIITFNVGIQRNGVDMKGKLLSLNGHEMKLSPPNVVGQPGKIDILEVQTLLEAAGISSLDDPLVVFDADLNTTQTMRYSGIIVLVVFTYSNVVTFDLNDIQYKIQVRFINNTQFGTIQIIYRKFPNAINERERHGVRFIFLQTGSLGKFDFQVLLLSLVSGIGLFALATIIVDVLAIVILPESSYYSKYKIDESLVYREIRDGKVKPEDDLTIAHKFKRLEQNELPSEDENIINI